MDYASSLYKLTTALLALGMFHVQVHVNTCLDVQACAPCTPSAFSTRRMVDQIRGIDLDVVPEDRYLQGYMGVQDVYQIP